MSRTQFHKIWVQQCRATRGIKRRFGVKSALDYLIGEKLMNFVLLMRQSGIGSLPPSFHGFKPQCGTSSTPMSLLVI
jgi:hypothetical protein